MCPGRISGLFWTLLGGTDRPPVRVDKGRGGKGEGGERVFFLRPPRSRAWLNDALGVTGAPRRERPTDDPFFHAGRPGGGGVRA